MLGAMLLFVGATGLVLCVFFAVAEAIIRRSN
jgi:hypothetical protein